MNPEEMQQKWSLLSTEIISGMAECRLQHPKASFREVEAEVDQRLSGLRAKNIVGHSHLEFSNRASG